MENQMDQETMRAFIEGLDGAAVLDQAGAYTYVSPSWERYTGISAEDALGKKVWELVPDTHDFCFLNSFGSISMRQKTEV